MDTPTEVPIRYRAFGAEGNVLTQVGRVREGLVMMGAVEGDKGSCDVVYANDAGTHAEAIAWRDLYAPTAKLILNVLDLPLQLLPPDGDYGYDKLANLAALLRRADAVTAISRYVQGQIEQCFGLTSSLIFNPIKPVSPEKRLRGERPYPYKVLMVGRVNDRNKRQRTIGIPALIAAGYQEDEVAVVGGEWPGWGTALGVVSNETLNDLYNSVDIVMQPSCLVGLELPVIEAMVCGAVPIVCHDLTTISEMPIPRRWWTYPSPAAVAYRLRILQANPYILEEDRMHCLRNSDSLRAQFSPQMVAARILDVYRQMIGPTSPSL